MKFSSLLPTFTFISVTVFTLVSCASTELSTSSTPSLSTESEQTFPEIKEQQQNSTNSQDALLIDTSNQVKRSSSVTLEKIMSDPDWIGRSPMDWYWGDDSGSVLFKQKRAGYRIYDLYRRSLTDVDTSEP